MNQGIKLKYDQMRDNNPASANDETRSDNAYPAASNTRNLDFVQLDGKRFFRNYSYMIGADYDPGEQKITLEFTSCTVKITGQKLELLYMELMEQIPRIIQVTDKRYNSVAEENVPIINEIIIRLNT